MNLVLDHDIVSLTDFARRTREHTAELKKHGRPRVLTHNGKAAAVVLSVAAYEELAHDAEERRADMALKAAIEAYARGERGTPGPLAFQQIRERAAKRRAAK
jgi:PHD/YefM family antitoxin component YafN of YafNO toxin-antitoxin module